MTAAHVLYALLVEFLAVSLGIIVAGSSDDMGKVTLVFYIGLMLVWIVTHPAALTRLNNIAALAT